MITDILVFRTLGNVSIRTATIAHKDDYIAHELSDRLTESLFEEAKKKGIDVREIIWDERYKSDCIMFEISENDSGKTIGFCEINHILSEEPTIGIKLAAEYRGKGYGFLAAKMMIEEGWKIFDHPYFVWELEQENTASRKLILKLGGRLIDSRCALSESMIQVLRENGIEFDSKELPNSIERYAIERPRASQQ